MLEECPLSPLDVLDILLGALDAHLALPQETSWRWINMVNKLRTTLLLVFTAYIGFVIGGLSFYGLVDDSPAVVLMKTNTSLSTTWRTVQIGSAISLLAVVAGGLPLALTILRRALTVSRRDLRWLMIPVVSFLAFLFYGVLLAAVGKGWLQIPGVAPKVSPDNFPIGNRLLLGGLMLVFVAGAIASTASVWKMVSSAWTEETPVKLFGSTTPLRLYDYAFPLAIVTTLSMLLMLIATLLFGWLASSALPQWFAGDYGLLLTHTTLSFGTTIAIMTLSTALAIFGLARGFTYRRTRQPM